MQRPIVLFWTEASGSICHHLQSLHKPHCSFMTFFSSRVSCLQDGVHVVEPADGWCGHGLKIPSHGLQSVFLLVDLTLGSDAKPAENGNRRTPSLQGVHEEEALDDDRQDQPFLIVGQGKDEPREGQRGRHCFEGTLNIPFLVELS